MLASASGTAGRAKLPLPSRGRRRRSYEAVPNRLRIVPEGVEKVQGWQILDSFGVRAAQSGGCPFGSATIPPSAMKVLEVLAQLKAIPAWTQEGEEVDVEFAPGTTKEKVEELCKVNFSESAVLPDDFQALLLECAGIDCGYEIDFLGQSGQSASFLSEDELPIAIDGFGNSWNVFPPQHKSELSLVLFCCHDPPVIVCQSNGMADFLTHFRNCYDPESTPSLAQTEDAHSMRIYRDNPGRIPVSEARLHSDPEISEFASTLPDHYYFYDFRNPKHGDGFTWAYGREPFPTCKRSGVGWLVGISPGSKSNSGSEEKKSFLQRLFGR